ncbi:MAG TPA: DUF2304 domain-containing protein [Candidatus Hydrogenedentes bacterium]|nr:DUF2304 domain-containing protein [Candidatus Hydrogenedentota bacterium]
MEIRQKILAAVFGIALLVSIIVLVHRRKLKEEYSWLWIAAGVAILAIGLNYWLLEWITKAIGAGWTTATLFFFGIFFVLALSLQFSVKISTLENQVKNLAQQLAILQARENSTKEDTGKGTE